MKRFVLSFVFIVGIMMPSFSKPVDSSLAALAASKFAKQHFSVERQEMTLVMTGLYDAYYIFTAADRGFVIIAADDAYRPVIGYSDESVFDVNDIPPALMDYLDGIALSIHRLRGRGDAVATPMVAAEWESLLTHGTLLSRHLGRGVDYLCQTKWNQTYPYNYCCPEDPNGSGGHAIVGCLATAMSQLMRFWASPIQGVGSHCYYHEDYGQICADFGNTTYDWEHMPNVLNDNASEEEKLATGTLCFHCGVTIDMGYGPDGSGGASGPIPGVMHTYFNYSDAIVQRSRNDYELETWKAMVREQFDMGWPMYYGGCQDGGCHAFVCDGYDDNDLFHFNLGWGGGSDGWYIIDEAPYTSPADAMFNFVPATVYDQTPDAPADFTVVPASETDLRTVLHWSNPSVTLNGTPLSSIEEVVVMRDGEVIQTFTDVTPGTAMEMEDNEVPRFDLFHYTLYVKANGRNGRHVHFNVSVGPSCTWTVLMSSTDYHGWNGGAIAVYNGAGHDVAHCTLESSAPSTAQPVLPLGSLRFGWTAPEETVDNLSFFIKDAEGNMLYSFTGSSDELAPGVFFETNNGCGSDVTCGMPTNLVATSDGGHVMLTWDPVEDAGYGYIIYRDGLLCRLLPSENVFLDEQAGIGGHCYQVAVLCEGGEGGFSNLSCASDGPCYPPRDLDYELTSNYKIKLVWEAPAVTEGFSGYYIYRKPQDGEYQRIKMLGSSALSYIDNAPLEEGDYYYKVCAYYHQMDCLSAPANIKGESNVFELLAYYSPTGLDEDGQTLKIAPNPTDGTVFVTGAGLRFVEVYNTVGQSVIEQVAESETVSIDMRGWPAGIYVVRVVDCDGNSCVRKVVKQ